MQVQILGGVKGRWTLFRIQDVNKPDVTEDQLRHAGS